MQALPLAVVIAKYSHQAALKSSEPKQGKRGNDVAGMKHQLYSPFIEHIYRLVNALEIVMTVCVEPGYFADDVEEALFMVFSNRDLADGRRGFFHPDNFTFGQPVYLSQVISWAMQVPGVRWVDLTDRGYGLNRFRRWGEESYGEFDAGVITLGRLEIARLDNDPNAQENGSIAFLMEGGV